MLKKIFLNSKNIATFICPNCNNVVTKDLSNYVNIENKVTLKCKCKCGNVYPAEIERRGFYRKIVAFRGSYLNIENDKKGLMEIIDASQAGLRIKIDSTGDIKLTERLILKFKLDDDQEMVSKEVIVKNINGIVIGVQFVSTEHYDSFGSYLIRR